MLEAIILLDLMDRKGGLQEGWQRYEYELHEEQECQIRKKSTLNFNELQRSNTYTHLLAAVFKKCQSEERTLKEQMI
jgi:hypothetical protein